MKQLLFSLVAIAAFVPGLALANPYYQAARAQQVQALQQYLARIDAEMLACQQACQQLNVQYALAMRPGMDYYRLHLSQQYQALGNYYLQLSALRAQVAAQLDPPSRGGNRPIRSANSYGGSPRGSDPYHKIRLEYMERMSDNTARAMRFLD
jgi:hypothetical protein